MNGALSIPAAAYDRVSTFKQLGTRFTSCEAQSEICAKFITQHVNQGWFLAERFSDPAYSGKNLERPGMRAMKEAIAAGRIKVVVAYKIERLLRSTDEWPQFRRFLQEHNCQLVSVSEGVAENTAAGRFRTSMMVAQSAYERENTGEKVTDKRLADAAHGFWLGGYDPFGYDNDKKEKQLVLNETEEAIVRKVYDLASRLVPLTEIAAKLNAEGVRTRVRTLKSRDRVEYKVGGVRIRSDWLRQMIRNPIYKGRITCQGQEFNGQHTPIVNADLWSAANAAIKQSLKPARCSQPRRDRHFNVLKGLIFCGDCGRAMVPHASGKIVQHRNPYRYYTCDKVMKERGDTSCRVRRVSGPPIESCVVSILGQLAQRPEVIEAALAAGRSGSQKQKEEWEKRLHRISGELSQITQQLNNVVDALAKSGLKALNEELKDRIQQLTTRKDAMLVERERLQQDLAAFRQEDLAPDKLSEALGKFDSVWASLSPDEKRELMQLAVAKVEIRAGRGATGESDGTVHRLLSLSIKLHLPELLAAAGGSMGKRKSRLLSIAASVEIPVNGAGDALITVPFKHRIPAPKPVARKASATNFHGELHPIHRAKALVKVLEETPTLNPQVLAAREGISAATLCQWRKLVRLCPEVQRALMEIKDRATAWRCSIRRLLPLVLLPPSKQWDAFLKLNKSRRSRRLGPSAPNPVSANSAA